MNYTAWRTNHATKNSTMVVAGFTSAGGPATVYVVEDMKSRRGVAYRRIVRQMHDVTAGAAEAYIQKWRDEAGGITVKVGNPGTFFSDAGDAVTRMEDVALHVSKRWGWRSLSGQKERRELVVASGLFGRHYVREQVVGKDSNWTYSFSTLQDAEDFAQRTRDEQLPYAVEIPANPEPLTPATPVLTRHGIALSPILL